MNQWTDDGNPDLTYVKPRGVLETTVNGHPVAIEYRDANAERRSIQQPAPELSYSAQMLVDEAMDVARQIAELSNPDGTPKTDAFGRPYTAELERLKLRAQTLQAEFQYQLAVDAQQAREQEAAQAAVRRWDEEAHMLSRVELYRRHVAGQLAARGVPASTIAEITQTITFEDVPADF